MRAVNLKYAKTHLDRLVDQAMTPVTALKKRVFGLDQGKIVIRDDFDAPLPELETILDGSPDDPR